MPLNACRANGYRQQQGSSQRGPPPASTHQAAAAGSGPLQQTPQLCSRQPPQGAGQPNQAPASMHRWAARLREMQAICLLHDVVFQVVASFIQIVTQGTVMAQDKVFAQPCLVSMPSEDPAVHHAIAAFAR